MVTWSWTTVTLTVLVAFCLCETVFGRGLVHKMSIDHALESNGKVKDTSNWCPLQFKDCGSVEGQVATVKINGTCKGGVAILKKQTTVDIDFHFKAKIQEAKLTSKVHGKIGVLPFVPFPLDNPDACKNSGLKCPIPANTDEDYIPALNILKSYPSVNVIVKWELIDGSSKDVFCVEVPATIVD